MNPPTRISTHLAVLGCALVTAAVRPSHPSVAPGDMARAARMPAEATVVTVVHREATTAVKTSPHRHHRRSVRRRPTAVRRSGAPSRHTSMHPRPAPQPNPTYAGPTDWAGLNRDIAMIPTYRPGLVRWTVSHRYGHWGTDDWYDAVIYVSPDVPAGYLYDVAVHEWSHELSVLDYDGDVNAAVRAMDAAFGGTGLVGAERAADCMAILQGATWTHYTNCHDAAWRADAARLVRGEQL